MEYLEAWEAVFVNFSSRLTRAGSLGPLRTQARGLHLAPRRCCGLAHPVHAVHLGRNAVLIGTWQADSPIRTTQQLASYPLIVALRLVDMVSVAVRSLAGDVIAGQFRATHPEFRHPRKTRSAAIKRGGPRVGVLTAAALPH